MAKKHLGEMLSTLSHQANANKKYSEILSYTSQNDKAD